MSSDYAILRSIYPANVLCAAGLGRHVGGLPAKETDCKCGNKETKAMFVELAKENNVAMAMMKAKGIV